MAFINWKNSNNAKLHAQKKEKQCGYKYITLFNFKHHALSITCIEYI
jgi:hypothetical protein